MRVRNVHERVLPATRRQVEGLIDGLAVPNDQLWPRNWPPMRFDRPLSVGAEGGHGPIRYAVDTLEPGRIAFTFKGPRGLTGHSHFEIAEHGDQVRLRHIIEVQVRGVMLLDWPFVLRPLHDALLEDALDGAERACGHEPVQPASWTWRVKLLRRLMAPGSR